MMSVGILNSFRTHIRRSFFEFLLRRRRLKGSEAGVARGRNCLEWGMAWDGIPLIPASLLSSFIR
jgi:hypothetical protein